MPHNVCCSSVTWLNFDFTFTKLLLVLVKEAYKDFRHSFPSALVISLWKGRWKGNRWNLGAIWTFLILMTSCSKKDFQNSDCHFSVKLITKDLDTCMSHQIWPRCPDHWPLPYDNTPGCNTLVMVRIGVKTAAAIVLVCGQHTFFPFNMLKRSRVVWVHCFEVVPVIQIV